MSTIHLVYAPENADLADLLTQQLGRIGLPFQHLSIRADETPGQLATRASASAGPVLIILTDNFLKNRHCMANALAMFQSLSKANRLLTVVANGRKVSEDGQQEESVPTQFDRVVHAIQYLNYWQTTYLDLNEGLPDVAPEEKERYEQNLEIVRNIANEVGELFSFLKESGYCSWAQLAADDYALFFRHFGLLEWHEQYRKLAALDHEAPPPTGPETIARATPLAAIPPVPGPLVPVPAEDLPEDLPEKLSPNGIDTFRDETPDQEEADSAEIPAIPASEPVDEPANREIRQAIDDAWFWLGKGYTDRGLELFRLAVEQHPHSKPLYVEYQRALDQYGTADIETPEAEETPSVEPETPPTPPAPETAPEATDQAQEAASYNQMGENALAKGDYLLAKYCWDRVTDMDPQFPGIYRKLALLTSEHLTDYKETAAHYLEEALVAEPDDAGLHYRLALLLRDHLDQPAKALQHFRDTVVLQPDHGEAWIALAQFTLEAGDRVQAENLYRHALEVQPSLQSEDYDAHFIQPREEPQQELPEPEPEEIAVSAGEALAVAPVEEEEPAVAQAEEPAKIRSEEPLTVLITGATSGIGRATAELFARHGHRILLAARRSERLEELKQHFQTDYQSEVHVLTVDVRDTHAVQSTFENLPEAWQNIDVLINNAGLAKGLAPIHEGNLEHWETMIDTNIKGLLYVTRCVTPGMVQRRKGHIVNISSSAGKEVYPNGNVYCATKFAVEALTQGMRLDLHKYNIRVSQVSPGHVEETEFALTRFDGDEARAKIYQDFQPLKASDVAESIYFIVTRPPHVNIQDIWMFGTQQASATVIDRSGR